MTVQVLTRGSALLYDRPFPNLMGVQELCVNTNATDPGLYFSDSSNATLIKVGPTFIGSTTPNVTPSGYASFCKGESWLDTSSTYIHKLFDGTSWQTPKAVVSNSNGKPSNPIDGQLHYDKLVPGLFMYNAATTTWIAI